MSEGPGGTLTARNISLPLRTPPWSFRISSSGRCSRGEKWKRVIPEPGFSCRAPASLAVRWHFVFAVSLSLSETPPPQKGGPHHGRVPLLLDVSGFPECPSDRSLSDLERSGDLSCEFTKGKCFFSELGLPPQRLRKLVGSFLPRLLE